MRPKLATPLALVGAAALIALLVYGVSATSDDRTLDSAVARGTHPAAPQRALPLLGGSGSHSLGDWRGHVVVLNFWASWCDPCRAEAPLLERTQRTLAAHGDTVLGVAFRDATPDALGFARRYGVTYPSLRDVDGKLADAYGTRALPETFVIDRGQRIVALRRGEVDQRFLDEALARANAS